MEQREREKKFIYYNKADGAEVKNQYFAVGN